MDIANFRDLNADQAVSPFRALHSLTEAKAHCLANSLASLAPDWVIGQHESCDGHLTLLLTHTIGDASILIDRDKAGIHVGLMLGDELHALPQPYASLGDAAVAVKQLAGTHEVGAQRSSA